MRDIEKPRKNGPKCIGKVIRIIDNVCQNYP